MMKAEQVLDATKFPLEAEEKTESAVYVGMDCTHATVRKRIFALQAAGMDITGFTFRREKSNKDFVPDWNNVELGVTLDQNYGQRLKALLGALRILVGRRETLRAAKFIYARNFDNAFMAMAASFYPDPKPSLYMKFRTSRSSSSERACVRRSSVRLKNSCSNARRWSLRLRPDS